MFNEYIQNAKMTTRMCGLSLIPLLLMVQLLPDNIVEELYYPSKIHHLKELSTRLTDDARYFQVFDIIEFAIYFQSIYIRRTIPEFNFPLCRKRNTFQCIILSERQSRIYWREFFKSYN